MKNIKIGTGVGKLKFGMYADDVEEILGEPNEVEQDEEGENWHYDDEDMSMSFDEDQRLVTIAVSDKSYTIEGVKLIGQDIDFVEQQLDNMELGTYSFEDVEDEFQSDLALMSFPDTSINFWFENGELTEIQFWPLFTDDEEIIWPDQE